MDTPGTPAARARAIETGAIPRIRATPDREAQLEPELQTPATLRREWASPELHRTTDATFVEKDSQPPRRSKRPPKPKLDPDAASADEVRRALGSSSSSSAQAGEDPMDEDW